MFSTVRTERKAGGWKRKKRVFGMLGVNKRGRRQAKPVLRLVERSRRRDPVPLIAHRVKVGSTIISDELRSYRNALPQLGYTHFTVNHSVSYVDAQTGAHTQHIERAWRTVKENVWRLGESYRGVTGRPSQLLNGISVLPTSIAKGH